MKKNSILQKYALLAAASVLSASVLLSCSSVRISFAAGEPSASSAAVSSALPAASETPGIYRDISEGASSAAQNSSSGEVQYYFPRARQKAQPVLLGIINSAKRTLDVAIYSFTDKDIASALVKAKNRSVSVRVITDRTQAETSYQKTVLRQLTKAGIPVKVDTHSGIMHLKVTIADGQTATTGSFNYTQSAENTNDEVFVVLNSSKIAQDFEKEFSSMWSDSGNFKKYS